MRGVTVWALVAVTAGACSFTMDTVPNGWEPKRDPWCDASRLNPIADASVAVGAGVFGVFLLQQHGACDTRNCRSITTSFALVSLAVVVTGALAAWVGFRRAAHCREARREHSEWLHSHPRAGPPGAER